MAALGIRHVVDYGGGLQTTVHAVIACMTTRATAPLIAMAPDGYSLEVGYNNWQHPQVTQHETSSTDGDCRSDFARLRLAG